MSEENKPVNENQEENQEEIDQDELAKQWEEALQQQEEKTEEVNEEPEEAPQKETVSEKEEESLDEYIRNEKLELLMDIPLEVSVEIGGKDILLEDILKLNPNTILELDKYINEPVDIKINGKLIAKGELYTAENNFGVKITNIITVQERMKLFFEEGGK
jgi:flagellar motor switch protein FliN/FliY